MNDPPTGHTSRTDTACAAGTALQIAQILAAEKVDTTQAGKLSKAWNISTLHVADALNALRAAGERQEPDVRSPEVK